MANFKFVLQDWKLFILVPMLLTPLYRFLQDDLSFGLAAAVTTVAGVVLYFLAGKYFNSRVVFKDSYLVLKKGFSAKEVKLFYSDVQSFTFAQDRYSTFYVNTAEKQIELPTARQEKVAELFRWLSSRNPQIDFSIINPKHPIS